MFSQSKNTTKAIARNSKQEDGYIVYSKFHNLPGKRVLFLTSDEDRESTTLKIYSIDNLAECFLERSFKGSYE